MPGTGCHNTRRFWTCAVQDERRCERVQAGQPEFRHNSAAKHRCQHSQIRSAPAVLLELGAHQQSVVRESLDRRGRVRNVCVKEATIAPEVRVVRVLPRLIVQAMGLSTLHGYVEHASCRPRDAHASCYPSGGYLPQM